MKNFIYYLALGLLAMTGGYAIFLYLSTDFEAAVEISHFTDKNQIACDERWGAGNWRTINIEWIDFKREFILTNPDLFYTLETETVNGNQTYPASCVGK